MTTKAEFADVRFKAGDLPHQPSIITLENGPKTNTLLDDKTEFILILKDGTTAQQTQDLVAHLNRLVKQISLQRH